MHSFQFRASELEELSILLGDFALVERPGLPSELLRRLQEAGLVEVVPETDPFTCWTLTPEGRTVIQQALG
jgi:DNA-binding MarR family transcriptional regulator